MRYWNPNAHGLMKYALQKLSKVLRYRKFSLEIKEMSTEMLLDINPLAGQWMLENLPTDEGKKNGKKTGMWSTASKKQGSFKENANESNPLKNITRVLEAGKLSWCGA